MDPVTAVANGITEGIKLYDKLFDAMSKADQAAIASADAKVIIAGLTLLTTIGTKLDEAVKNVGLVITGSNQG
jgi:energy-converting hydrogenase Eha subunit G